MMRFEARAQNNTHIGNGKNPCTKVESRWREEREKNVQRAHIFLLCCLMVARKKGRNGRKIYTHNITNDMFGLGEAPGATSFLMARICWSTGLTEPNWARERENESWKLRNTEKSRHCRRAAGIHFYTLELCALCARIGSLFFLQFSISHGDMQQYRAPSKTYAPNSLLVHSFTRKSVDAMQKQRIEWREKNTHFLGE